MRKSMAALLAAIVISIGLGIGIGVGVGMAQAQPAAPRIPLGGGSGIIFSSRSICSLTTIGYDARGRLVGLTAAHCANLGDRVAGEQIQHRVGGKIVPVGEVVTRNARLDYEVIAFRPDLVAPIRSVGATTIDGIGTFPGPGSLVCDNGRSTGHACGIVWAPIDGYWADQACATHGDSGGPVTVGDRVVGMTNAGVYGFGPLQLPDCTNPANPVHAVALSTSMSTILTDLDAHPAAIGAGFHTF